MRTNFKIQVEKLKTHCVIIGWFGYSNLGDELILHTLLSHLRNKNWAFTVVSRNPGQTRQMHNVNAVPNNWLSISCIRQANKIIFGGGQLFNDNRFRTIPLWCSLLRVIRRLNRKAEIILLSQGFEVGNDVLRRILSQALHDADFISVRDSASFEFAKTLNLNIPIFCGPDIVFAYSDNDVEDRTAYTTSDDVRTIGINLRPPFWWRNKSAADSYMRNLAHSLDMLVDESNVEIVFVPFRLSGKEPP